MQPPVASRNPPGDCSGVYAGDFCGFPQVNRPFGQNVEYFHGAASGFANSTHSTSIVNHLSATTCRNLLGQVTDHVLDYKLKTIIARPLDFCSWLRKSAFYQEDNVARRPNFRFMSPKDLDSLAASVEQAAKTLRHAAVLIEQSGSDRIALGHLSKVEDCTKAAQLIVLEVRRKLLLSGRHTVGEGPDLSSKSPPDAHRSSLSESDSSCLCDGLCGDSDTVV